MESRPTEQRRLMEAALASGADGVIIVDAKGRLVFINEAGRRLMQRVPSSELPVPQQAAEFKLRYLDGRPMPPEETPLGRAVRGETVVDWQVVLAKPDGGDAYFSNSTSPIYDEQGRAIGAVAIFRDVTEHVLAEQRAAKLAEINRMANEQLALSALAAQEAAEREQGMREQLQKSEERFRLLLESTGEGIFGIDLLGRCTFLNRSGAAMFGYTPEEVLGKNIHELVHHSRDDGSPHPQDECPISRSLQLGRTLRVENEVFWRGDGTAFPVAYSSSPIFEGVAIAGAVVVFVDVTERKRAEEGRAKLASEQIARTTAEKRTRELETLIEAVPDGVLVADRQGIVVAVNSALVALVGFADRSEALKPLAQYGQFLHAFHPDGRPMALEEWATMRALRGERVLVAEARLRLRDGREHLVESSAAPMLDERDEVVQAVTVVRDVGEQRRWEQQRAVLSRVGQALSQGMDMQAVLQTVVDQTLQALGADTAGVFTADPKQQVLVLVAHRNLPPEAAQSLHYVPLDAPFFSARAFATGRIQVVEDVSQLAPELRAARSVADLAGLRSLMAVPLLAAGRPVGAMIAGTRDLRRFAPDELETVARVADLFGMAIDNARLYEASQHRAEELEEQRQRREEFTSVVAHELRSPMTVLGGYTQLLRREERPEPERLRRALEVMGDQVGKLNWLVSDLLDFSRIEAGRFTVERVLMDLGVIAAQVVEEQQATTGRHRLMLEVHDGPIGGHWDPVRLVQGLTNLVSNAIKYSPEGGEVRVVVGRGKGEAMVSVCDQGVGIAQADIPLLFQPYSRLYRERRARGVGLGLFITKGIVEAHGGRLWVESEPGEGSTFYVALPLT